MLIIETERLKIIPLNFEQLQLLKQSRMLLEESLGLKASAMEVDELFMAEIDEAMDFWLKGTLNHPEKYAWFSNWEIILKKERMVVGGIGLTGLPDDRGEVMTGYYIDKKYQRQGLASEALAALVTWIFSHPETNVIRADTPLDNIPSQGVLLKNHFVKTGEYDGCFQWRRYK